MELGQLLKDIHSKKFGVTVTTIAVLAYLNAHPAYIATVAIVELLIQGWLDKPKKTLKENENELD